MTDKQVPVKLDQILAFLAMICRLNMHINYSVLPVGLNRNVNGTPEGKATPTWKLFWHTCGSKGKLQIFQNRWTYAALQCYVWSKCVLWGLVAVIVLHLRMNDMQHASEQKTLTTWVLSYFSALSNICQVWMSGWSIQWSSSWPTYARSTDTLDWTQHCKILSSETVSFSYRQACNIISVVYLYKREKFPILRPNIAK